VWQGVEGSETKEGLKAQWPHVRTTFPGSKACLGLDQGPCFGYEEQPRTQAELVAEGWVRISSCADEHPK